ncbi:general stress protein [Pseudomonas sp. GD03842]|uniref:general stress protein n=1 Tax=unclassified Pseudomonas TaxID=196821 RepID=UPI000D3B766F|nr:MULTISPECIES: general stress protein [unclassified Pseudomonas]MDH0744974.1 general stress protein [Pseudomonas sp. GD03842]RAU41488.1 general stress protein [Pseudomonas sp. RIT 409]RAU53311.1 general stress protein [Pseudomonas sp. RIT 412]
MANTGKSNPGNFANDRQKASEAGKKGGQASGGSNVADDRQKASDANKKGGSMPQGGAGRKS